MHTILILHECPLQFSVHNKDLVMLLHNNNNIMSCTYMHTCKYACVHMMEAACYVHVGPLQNPLTTTLSYKKLFMAPRKCMVLYFAVM